MSVWQVLLSSSVAFVGLAMAWREAEAACSARELDGSFQHKNPMRDSNWSSGSTSPSPRCDTVVLHSPSPRPTLDLGGDGSSGPDTSPLRLEQIGDAGDSAAVDADSLAARGQEGSSRPSRQRLSLRTWSGPSPRARNQSDLEESLTPRGAQ